MPITHENQNDLSNCTIDHDSIPATASPIHPYHEEYPYQDHV